MQFKFKNILKGGYYESPLGYDKVDWFLNEVLKLEKKPC